MRLVLAQQSSQGRCLVCCRALCNSTPLSSSQLPMAVIDTALCQQPDCLPLLEKSVRSLSCVCSWLLNWVYQISRYTGYQRLPDLWATDCMLGDTLETLVRNTPNNIWNNILFSAGTTHLQERNSELIMQVNTHRCRSTRRMETTACWRASCRPEKQTLEKEVKLSWFSSFCCQFKCWISCLVLQIRPSQLNQVAFFSLNV